MTAHAQELPFRERLLTPSSFSAGHLARAMSKQTADAGRRFARLTSLQSTREQDVARVLSRAVAAAEQLPVGIIARRVKNILPQLRTLLLMRDTSKLPQMAAWTAEDGAFVIECSLHDRRLGLTFDAQAKDSGWYFASLDSSKEGYASFDDGSLAKAVEALLSP